MLIRLLVSALAFYVTAYIVPGFTVNGWQTLLVMSVVWGILSILLKPILLLLTLPITIITLGLFTFVINALLLMLMETIVPGFHVTGFGTALLSSVVLAIVNMVLSQIIID